MIISLCNKKFHYKIREFPSDHNIIENPCDFYIKKSVITEIDAALRSMCEKSLCIFINVPDVVDKISKYLKINK